jgi:adenylate kinase family enzyme
VRRVVVNGVSGSGKTTVARELARRLGAPHVELDGLQHGLNWRQASDDELRGRLEPYLAGTNWIVDGNYHARVGDLVLARADTVIWLELPLALTLLRLLRRTLRRVLRREELWSGNRETLRTAFVGRESLFVWTLRRRLADRHELPAVYARYPHLDVVHIRTSRALAELVAGVTR